MVVKNGQVFHPETGFIRENVYIQGDRFVGACAEEEIVDAEGLYVIPGLMDIHFHGCVGCDVCDGTPEALDAIARRQASQGVTAMCPATMTLCEEQLASILQNVGKYCSPADGATLCGINLEGPFLASAKKGAQNGAYLQNPEIALFHRLQKAAQGLIKLVDIAPELSGAMDFIEAVSKETVISIAHTAADYQTTAEAFRRGARHVTHFYNAMTAFGHREPGVVGAAFDDEDCMVELICDGVHVHPVAVRTAMCVLGAERVVFVSDSMRAAGLGDGVYDLGGQQVSVKGKRACLSNGTLAGSCTELMDCLRTAVQTMGVSLEQAVLCSTANPAKAIGLFDQRGSIDPGKIADVVLLRPNLEIAAVILRGRLLEQKV